MSVAQTFKKLPSGEMKSVPVNIHGYPWNLLGTFEGVPKPAVAPESADDSPPKLSWSFQLRRWLKSFPSPFSK